MNALALADPEIANEKARNGDLDGAIELSRSAIAGMYDTGAMLSLGVATKILVETLLDRGADGDLQEAQAAIDRLDLATHRARLPLARAAAVVG